MSQSCPQCRETYGPEIGVCPNCICELVPAVAEPASPPPPAQEPVVVAPPAPADGEPWTTAVCWNCATPSPNGANTTCLAPGCRRRLVPPVLVVTFTYGQIELAPGESVTLGRAGRHADTFLSYPNVSRVHTDIGAERDGRAWIKPRDAVNGTFLNDREVYPAEERDLRNRDTLRLGLDCRGTVRVYEFGGEAA